MDPQEIERDFRAKLDAARGKLGNLRPNVLVCGQTGSGKTSLIQAVCGEGLVPAEAVGDGVPTTTGFDEYADERIRFWDSKGFEPGGSGREFVKGMREFVRASMSGSAPDNHIHLVWHAIQASGARVTDCDLELLRDVFRPGHTIVVLTKADIARPEQIEAMTNRLAEAGIDRERIVPASDRAGGSIGCRELVGLSRRLLPEACRASFVEAQRIDREARVALVLARRGKAGAIVAAATATAAAIGATPVPVADALLLIPAQTGMIASLAALHGIGSEAIHHAVLPFVARMAGVHAASSLAKLVPGLGNAVNAAVAATVTGAMGWYVHSRFEAAALARIDGIPPAGPLFDYETFRRHFREYASLMPSRPKADGE